MRRCSSCFALFEEEFSICPHCGYVEGQPAKELYHLYPGMILGERYIVGQVLGFGGFGITYKVWDEKMRAVMAVKEYYPNGLVSRVPGTMDVRLVAHKYEDEFNHGVERFLDEARAMARFNAHRSIIHVFDFFEENGTAYFVMEYLDGVTLAEYMRSDDMDIPDALRVADAVASALEDIHKAGIVHRDVAPDNIFLCANGAIKLIDFGAARFSDGTAKLHTIILKPGFAPPEQYESISAQGPWTDIYALGATLYYMLTSQKPEESSNRKISDDLAPPKEIRSELPEYLNNSVLKAMAIDIHMRFKSAAEFRQAIAGERKVLPLAAEKKKRTRRRLLTVLASALVIAVGAGVFLQKWNQNRVEETLPDASIEVWIQGDDAKRIAFEDVVHIFNQSFPNVNVTVKIAKVDDLEITNLPALYEVENMAPQGASLDNIFKALALNDYRFLGSYAAMIQNDKSMPLGFVGNVDYLHAGAGAQGVGSKSDFLAGKASEYSGTTADYNEIQAKWPAQFTIEPSDNPQGKFGMFFQIGAVKADELRCAERLLQFFLSPNAQDRLLIQYPSGLLPLNKDALDLYCEVYPDFKGFFSNADEYVFN